jgi:hypothetical protein
MIDSKHHSIQPGTGQRSLIDVVRAALAAHFTVGCCIRSWNAAPYYMPGFQLSARRDGRVIIRHVLGDRLTRASRRAQIIAALERYQCTLIACGVFAELIDTRGKMPHLVC